MTAMVQWREILPYPVRRAVKTWQWRLERLLVLRKAPLSSDWGWGRGRPVDRHYIEGFLTDHAGDVCGRVLEFGDDRYARQFGGSQVTRLDVLHLTADNPQATIVADLAQGGQIPSDAFDCILCTQLLFLIYDFRAAIRTLHRILKPGGIVLVTAPGVAHQISRNEAEDYWRFTALSLRRMFEEVFPGEHVQVKSYGNVLAATAFLYGFAIEDLRREDLDPFDPDYPVVIALRAVKPLTPSL